MSFLLWKERQCGNADHTVDHTPMLAARAFSCPVVVALLTLTIINQLMALDSCHSSRAASLSLATSSFLENRALTADFDRPAGSRSSVNETCSQAYEPSRRHTQFEACR